MKDTRNEPRDPRCDSNCDSTASYQLSRSLLPVADPVGVTMNVTRNRPWFQIRSQPIPVLSRASIALNSCGLKGPVAGNTLKENLFQGNTVDSCH